MSLKTFPAQSDFIQRLKTVVPPSRSLAEEMSELLHISPDSAYRRMRGETALSIDEVVTLCHHYRISFEGFSKGTQHSGSVSFNYRPLKSERSGFNEYLQNLLNDLKQIKSFDQKQIIFASEDIPIFHHFRFPELTAFKIFYWEKSILNIPELEKKKFSVSSVDQEILDMARQTLDLYSSIPCIEIWTEDTIVGTLKQIEFYWESGLFERPADALLLCEQVGEVLQTIQKQAERETALRTDKQKIEAGASYTLYHSEVTIGNNCIFVNTGGNKATYIAHHTFNSMVTTNAVFCEETEQWLKTLIKKSILISGISEKQRYQFFTKVEEHLHKLRSKIKA